MSIQIDIQYSKNLNRDEYDFPENKQIEQWLNCCLSQVEIEPKSQAPEICIRFVSNAEIKQLNAQYRDKNQVTNILSFSAEIPEFVDDIYLLGDLVIAPDIIKSEAKTQLKSMLSHWAHIIVHGFLHLQGYNHEDNHDANIMETLEIEILNLLGFDNPYINCH